MSVSNLKDHAWRRATVGDLQAPARALLEAIIQFTPDQVSHRPDLLVQCTNALATVLAHPKCVELYGRLTIPRTLLFACLTDFTTKSLRDSNDLFEIHLDMLAKETGFDPRLLPTVKRLFQATETRTCMHRYLGGVAVAFVYGPK